MGLNVGCRRKFKVQTSIPLVGIFKGTTSSNLLVIGAIDQADQKQIINRSVSNGQNQKQNSLTGIEPGCSKKKHHISRTTCSILLLSGTIEIGDQGEQCVMLKVAKTKLFLRHGQDSNLRVQSTMD